jgi:hypothetical protein
LAVGSNTINLLFCLCGNLAWGVVVTVICWIFFGCIECLRYGTSGLLYFKMDNENKMNSGLRSLLVAVESQVMPGKEQDDMEEVPLILGKYLLIPQKPDCLANDPVDAKQKWGTHS